MIQCEEECRPFPEEAGRPVQDHVVTINQGSNPRICFNLMKTGNEIDYAEGSC